MYSHLNNSAKIFQVSALLYKVHDKETSERKELQNIDTMGTEYLI